MAKAKITYVYNPVTGKREYQIDYQSASDATTAEHERGHRKLVEVLLGKALADNKAIEVERGTQGSTVPTKKPADSLPPLAGRKKAH